MRISDWSSDVCSSDLGDERGTDLKKGAVFPIVHGLRTLALRHRIHHNNSFDRAQALVTAGVLSSELGRDLQQALAVFMRLRLIQQLADLDAGKPDGNLVALLALRRLDRALLRDALRVVNRSEERRVGKACVSNGRTRCMQAT